MSDTATTAAAAKEFLYARDGEFFLPTDASGSPWHPSVLHGGSATGLLGFAIDWLVAGGYFLFSSRTQMSLNCMWPSPPECSCRAMVPERNGPRGSLKSIIGTPLRRDV